MTFSSSKFVGANSMLKLYRSIMQNADLGCNKITFYMDHSIPKVFTMVVAENYSLQLKHNIQCSGNENMK